MSFTNHTPNYNLPQYVGTDKPTFLGDFNNAMTAIDTALHNNAQNAGEGLSELQQAQAALTETQETLSEVQTEVANVSGIAATVNQNVQQALSAANDATTAANSATSQIQPAVTAANQASADAQAAQQVANGNVSTLTSLSKRVTALEEAGAKGTADVLRNDKVTEGTTIKLNYPDYKFLAITLGRNFGLSDVSFANCTAMNELATQSVPVGGGSQNCEIFAITVKDITAESTMTLTISGAPQIGIIIIGIK